MSLYVCAYLRFRIFRRLIAVLSTFLLPFVWLLHFSSLTQLSIVTCTRMYVCEFGLIAVHAPIDTSSTLWTNLLSMDMWTVELCLLLI